MSCCQRTQFEPMSRSRDLAPRNYNPFPVMGLGPTGLPQQQENYYNTHSQAWTRGGNVTPANTPGYHTIPIKPMKESYENGKNIGGYLRMNQTWNSQPVYTSN